MDPKQDDDQWLSRDAIIDVTSKAAAGLLGLGVRGALESVAGHVGATIAGVASTPILAQIFKSVGTDLANRTLSKRETIRVEEAVVQAQNKIWERLVAGQKPRDDGFFEGTQGRTSPAEELFEGVLLKCKSEFEEKKAKYIANIFANAAFVDVSPALANQVLGLAGSLSYRQICTIAVIGRKEELGFDTTVWNASSLHSVNSQRTPTSLEFEAFQHELLDLGTGGRRLLSYIRTSQVMHESERGDLLPLGRVVFDLMSLKEVPREDLEWLIRKFGRAS